MKIKYDIKLNEKDATNYFDKDFNLNVSNNRIFKISDAGTDQIANVSINKITTIK
ncbi:hypothetical protein [Flavobacterium geliluteum]|uniref:hypothetical protein n=1 Tax=Flavobacterium geliluteum TaxID=2816120 RepID=UPI001B338930|nr:hypothetical protein [Flavobacterium geliluteum]